MFLAIKELKKEKKRFILIISIVILISYLVFFLTGLANGLSLGNRSAINLLDSKNIVLHEDSNVNLFASRLPQKENLTTLTAVRGVAYPGTVQDKTQAINVVLFALDPTARSFPQVINGRLAQTETEVVVSESFLREHEIELGETLFLSVIDQVVTVVGYTKDSKFNVAPVIYMSPEQLNLPYVSAYLLYEDDFSILEAEWELVSMEDFIRNIPGYTAQLYTFSLMIGFLIVIAVLIIGVFMYILTIQKKEIFGIMKIQGIRNRVIAKSVLGQTLFINSLGVLIGIGLVYVSSLLLPAKVPFTIDYGFYSLIGIGLVMISSVGAIFSVYSISKIDPLDVLK